MNPLKLSFIVTLLLLQANIIKAALPPGVELKQGIIITGTLQIKKGNYSLNGIDDPNYPVNMIPGSYAILTFTSIPLNK